PEAQLQLLKKGVAEFARGGNCGDVYNAITVGILGGEKPVALDANTQPAFNALAVCAARSGHHLTALRVSAELYQLDPETPLAYLVPESEIALGMYSDAVKDIKSLLKARPKDAHVVLVYAAGTCKLELWQPCLTAADKVAELLPAVADPVEKKQIELQLH